MAELDDLRAALEIARTIPPTPDDEDWPSWPSREGVTTISFLAPGSVEGGRFITVIRGVEADSFRLSGRLVSKADAERMSMRFKP